MKNNYAFFLIALLSLLLFGCAKNNNNNNSTTTVAQDKVFINEITNSTNNCINDARNGQMAQSIIDFLNLSNGISGNEQWANNMSTALENVTGTIQVDPNINRFDFYSYCGNYVWNSTTQLFQKTTNSSSIIISFPSNPSSTSNDVTIQLWNYSDNPYPINAEIFYLPKTAKGKITKGTTEIASLNFSANYSSVGFPTPLNMSYSIFMSPHNYNFSIQQINNKEFNFTSNIFSGNGCGITVTANVVFNYDDYDNFVLEDYLKSVRATYQNGNFIIKSNFDALSYFHLNNPTTFNLNSNLTNEVYNGTEKIADLKFLDINFDRKLYIYYKDGTSEDTNVYYDPFLANLKNMLRSIFGTDVDSWF